MKLYSTENNNKNLDDLQYPIKYGYYLVGYENTTSTNRQEEIVFLKSCTGLSDLTEYLKTKIVGFDKLLEDCPIEYSESNKDIKFYTLDIEDMITINDLLSNNYTITQINQKHIILRYAYIRKIKR